MTTQVPSYSFLYVARENQILPSFSMPIFLTFGFQIFSGIHAGALAGFFYLFSFDGE
jgi:hypothetical protein